jgi:hypothetical protein
MGEQALHLGPVDPLRLQRRERRGDIRALFGGDALAVLGQIGEHREEHESADEIERFVEAQVLQVTMHRIAVARAAMALHRRPPDRLCRLEQRLAAIGANDVAELCAQEAHVGIVGDRRKRSGVDIGHVRMLRCGRDRVNRAWGFEAES